MTVGSMENATARLPELEYARSPGEYKRPAYIFMALLVVYTIARGLVGAAARPMWFDELLTLDIASQPSLHEMLAAIARGFDSTPPVFFLVERLALSVPIKTEVALRLPSILAFSCALMCVFLYAKKRLGELIACLCALALLATSLFHPYLIEARSYNLMVACVALALVCYQRLPSLPWAALMGASLMFAESLHYYAVFAAIPFVLAEGVLLLRTRQIRWRAWIALGCGGLPLVFFWRLLQTTKTYYGAHLHSAPVLGRIPEYYGSYFFVPDMYGVAIAVVAIAGVLMARLPASDAAGVAEDGKGLKLVEPTLLSSLVALPLIIFVVARLLHGGLLVRYTLPAIIGIVLGLGYVLRMLPPRAIVFFALLLFCSLGVREMRFWHHSGLDPRERDFTTRSREEFEEVRNFVQSAGRLDLPVVFAESMLYPPVTYYCAADWTERLVYLTDESRELRYEGTDSVIKTIKGFRGFLPLRLVDYTKFTTEHSEFLVYSEPSEWPLRALLDEGNSVEVFKIEGNRWLYLVRMKSGAAP
jgi:hypothetical protein